MLLKYGPRTYSTLNSSEIINGPGAYTIYMVLDHKSRPKSKNKKKTNKKKQKKSGPYMPCVKSLFGSKLVSKFGI